MEKKTIVTYALLTHLKETNYNDYSSIAELFFPIVKKGIVVYAREKGSTNVMGRNISEIQEKVSDFFGITIPFSVLDFILSQIYKEIGNDQVFTYNKDKSFNINAFVFSDIDESIQIESGNIDLLKKDFIQFSKEQDQEPDFDALINFICSQNLELFSSNYGEYLDTSYHIPKYIALKFEEPTYFKTISDIYLGSIISSYFKYKIETPVSSTELLIDTNFFISLIDLNTHEATQTCNQLFDLCKSLGYKFSILFSTIDQIRHLLNSRICDFGSKEIGLIKDADIFGACIRRNLDKTGLERIKDSIDRLIREYDIDIIYEARIRDLVSEAKKSKKYKEFLQIRNNQKPSALNDTIAFLYVNKKRGDNIQEFADVKCWFLNNTFHKDYHTGLGYKLHQRYKIRANELLSLLWLANPGIDLDFNLLSKGGLATYIAKYKQQKTPSNTIIKEVNTRAKKALAFGKITEKDVFALSVRMAEGQLTNGEAKELSELPDDEFIETIKEFSSREYQVLEKIEKQTDLIGEQNSKIDALSELYRESQFQLSQWRYEKDRDMDVENKVMSQIFKYNRVGWLYILFVIIVMVLWVLNTINFKIVSDLISSIASLLLLLVTIFIRFVDHKSVLVCLKFILIKKSRKQQLDNLRAIYIKDYEQEYPPPTHD